jgi:uncharacterized paraquat-inducible protein A
MVSVKFNCPKCGGNVEVDAANTASSTTCQSCKATIETPNLVQAPERISKCAIACLILGILSIFTVFTAIPGIVLGHAGLLLISRAKGRLGGKALCIAGPAIAYVVISLIGLMMLCIILACLMNGGHT